MPLNRFNFHNQCTRRAVLLAKELGIPVVARQSVSIKVWSDLEFNYDRPCDDQVLGRWSCSGVLLTSLTEPIGLSTSDRLPPNGNSTKFERNALDTFAENSFKVVVGSALERARCRVKQAGRRLL